MKKSANAVAWGTFCLALIGVAPIPAAAATEPVTYQGQLKQDGVPFTGSCDLLFGLWDAATNGNPIETGIELLAVDIQDGLFQVELPFAPESFDGGDRWLEVGVRCPSTGTTGGRFTSLSPRERINFTPYALQTRGIFVDSDRNVGIGTTQPLYDLHLRTSGTPIGGTTKATFGLQNSFLAGLNFVDRWFDVSVSANVDLTLHQSANLSFKRRFAQDSLSGDTQLFLGADGKVGIGTDSPQEALHVAVPSSANNAILKLSAPDNNGIFQAGVRMCDGTDTAFETCAGIERSGTILKVSNAYGNIRFGTPQQNTVSISPNTVAIGSSSNQVDLTVSGNLNVRYANIDTGWVAGSTTVTIACPSGTRVIGGGCETQGNSDVVKRTYPGSDAGWICVFEIAASSHRAHAICAGLQ